MNVKDVIISMLRAWDKEEILSSTYDLPKTGRMLYPLSYGETRGEQGHILGSYACSPRISPSGQYLTINQAKLWFNGPLLESAVEVSTIVTTLFLKITMLVSKLLTTDSEKNP